MANQIRWSDDAIEVFEDLCQRIDQDSHFYASIFANEVNDLIELAAQYPNAGREVPEYNNPDIREFFYKSYRIIYRIKPEIIEVATIYHFSKILPDFLS